MAMERGHPTQYTTHVCLFVEMLGLLHCMRLSVQHLVCLYVAFFKNGSVPHGARTVAAEEDVPTIPIFDWSWLQRGGVMGLHSARSYWHTTKGVLTIYFPESVSAVNNWISGLLNEYASVGGRANCARCGIIRGGGVGFAPTTFGIHTLKAMEQMFRYVAETIDNRVLPSTISQHLTLNC